MTPADLNTLLQRADQAYTAIGEADPYAHHLPAVVVHHFTQDVPALAREVRRLADENEALRHHLRMLQNDALRQVGVDR